MSKRAGVVSEETRARLISSATDEFRLYGYEKASLRTICKNAGVTTGALYFFIHSKEELFEEILLPISKVVKCIGKDFIPVLLEDDYSPIEHFVDFYYDNIQLYQIIWNNQYNPVVKQYLSNVNDMFINQIINIVNTCCSEKKIVLLIDEQTVKWTVNVIYQSVLQLVSLGLDREKGKHHILVIIKLFKHASFSLIENTIEKKN